MADTGIQHERRQPQNIFEVINTNIVDMSQDMVAIAGMIRELYVKMDEIHAALYPPMKETEPIAPGADKSKQ